MDIPFESFATLIYRLGHPPKSKLSQQPLSPSQIFTSWLNHLPRPFPAGTGKHLFHLLFPHEGSRRRYGLKETKLALELERILCLNGLTRWDAAGYGDAGTGCLGKEMERMIRDRIPSGTKSPMTLGQVNKHLDNFAAHCSFSQLSQLPANFPSQPEILTILFRDSNLSPYSLSLLTQIILRDLSPLLNPLPKLRVSNPTAMLRLKTTAGPAQLDLYTAMRCWHPDMARLYHRGLGDLDLCADECENANLGGPSKIRGPVVGVNVQIPKCRKGRSVQDALKPFLQSSWSDQAGQKRPRDDAPRCIWAETKYDGYRMQIHVRVEEDGRVDLKIFSKSKRDSTADRLNTHAIILAALGLQIPDKLPLHQALRQNMKKPPERPVQQSIILEAEVVPYNESSREGGRGRGVEEFWWLGAAGVTADSWPSFRPDRHRHLCLYFFDILHLDGQNLLDTPLSRRRKLLERSVATIDHFSHCAEYTTIPLDQGEPMAKRALETAFARSSERREEGLVLKSPESIYLDSRWPWVKLKKDYIPNLGDCIDLVLLGAGWDADRARDLRVDTSVFTSFYMGVLTNHDRVKAKVETPHFEILFKVSYGLDRDVLELVNGNIRHGRWGTKPYDKDDRFKRRLLGLSWTYTIRKELPGPSVLFERPMCAEVMGAGFQKIPTSHHYELRWPRLQKIFEPKERSWTEALTSAALIDAAHQSLGYDMDFVARPSTSPKDDSIRALWRSSSAVALTDVPEMPTPSPERPSPKRNKSAPDLLGILKSSPTSPITSRRARGTILQRLFVDDTTGDVESEMHGTGLELLERSRSSKATHSPLAPTNVNTIPDISMMTPPYSRTSFTKRSRDHMSGNKRKRMKKDGKERPLSLLTRIRRSLMSTSTLASGEGV